MITFTKEQKALMKRGGVVYDKNDGYDYCIHEGRIYRTEHDSTDTMWEEIKIMKVFLIVYQYDNDVFKVIRYRENRSDALKRFKSENPQYKVIAIRELKDTLENLYL